MTETIQPSVIPTIQWEELSSQKVKLRITGSLNTNSISQIWNDVKNHQAKWLMANPTVKKELLLDASEISYLDGTGVAFLIDIPVSYTHLTLPTKRIV